MHFTIFYLFVCFSGSQLASKTSELSKACEKQFKLEQELAFYKLDAKFEHLGMLPLPEGVEVSHDLAPCNMHTLVHKNKIQYCNLLQSF